MKKKLILIGGGGHCKSCIDVVEAGGKFSIEGILDTQDKVGTSVLGYPVLATDESIDNYIHQDYSFLITVGQIKSAQIRKRLYDSLIQKKASLVTVVSPYAIVSPYAQIGRGTIVMHGVQVNAGAVVGNNVILNSGCLVEHDVKIGNNVHVSTHAIINGDVKVEDDCFLGSNSVVAHGRRIKMGTIIGAGSVLVRDVETPGIYVGNPAKLIKE